MTRGVYSEYELREQYIKVSGEQDFAAMSCVGTSKEQLDTRVVTKKCRGLKAKESVQGTGTGTLEQSLHVPYAIYKKIYDMSHTGLIAGVAAYGQDSRHPEFALTQRVIDEDGVEKYKAYPRCILESGPNRPIENGAEEVAQLDLTISLLPDEHNECMYEALLDDLDSTTKASWLQSFTPSLVHTT